MGARTSRRSRSVKIEQGRYGSRPRQTRQPLPIIVVVCDDARTAVSYLDELKRVLRGKLTLTVRRNPHDRASPTEVVEDAKRQLLSLRQAEFHDPSDKDSVWALIDLEATPERRSAAYDAKRLGDNSGVRVALSDPCYEVWTLLHLVNTGESFINCRAVLDRIEQEWQKRFNQPFGRKAQADYSKIIGDRIEAAARAKQRHKNNDPSWTEVYLLIEEVERLCAE